MKLRRKKKQWQKKQKKCMHYKNYKLLVHTINRVLFWNSQGFLGQTREYGVFECMAGWLDGGLADCLDGSLIGLYGTTLPPSPHHHHCCHRHIHLLAWMTDCLVVHAWLAIVPSLVLGLWCLTLQYCSGGSPCDMIVFVHSCVHHSCATQNCVCRR